MRKDRMYGETEGYLERYISHMPQQHTFANHISFTYRRRDEPLRALSMRLFCKEEGFQFPWRAKMVREILTGWGWKQSKGDKAAYFRTSTNGS
jgi:hypothetical protein